MFRLLPGCPQALLDPVCLPTTMSRTLPGCPQACLSICNYHVQALARLPASCLSICQLSCPGHCPAAPTDLRVYLPTTTFRSLPFCLQLPCPGHCPAALRACPQAYLSFRLLVFPVQTNVQLHAFLPVYLSTTLSRPLPGCMLSCLSICQLPCPGHCPAACFPVCLAATTIFGHCPTRPLPASCLSICN